MTDFLFNIGLNRSTNLSDGGRIERKAARSTAGLLALNFGGLVTASAVHDSDTEPTLMIRVAHLTPLAAGYLAHALCLMLDQEAVAFAEVERPETHGALVGPMASRWGEYNPEFFLMLDGSRAAVPALEVAA